MNDAHQVTLQQRHSGAFHRNVRADAHGNANSLRLRMMEESSGPEIV
jgi:hypothetical protein